MPKASAATSRAFPPTLAIDQSRPVRTSRSTVGTMTELHDHFKLLFAKIGVLHCRGCRRIVERDSALSIVNKLSSLPAGSPIVLTFSLPRSSVSWDEVRSGLQQAGFHRLLVDSAIEDLEAIDKAPSGKLLEVVIDRFVFRKENKKRICDSLEQ